ncbi:hypothetical protein IPJ72_06365 [Candidatus Peregrinibacteria bacterium]|nr:MAG: hypothetical protein IPJ72_06365 [Candidatus Peregrinibacteria bacterium]
MNDLFHHFRDFDSKKNWLFLDGNEGNESTPTMSETCSADQCAIELRGRSGK